MLHSELDLSVETSTTQELLDKVLSCKLDCAFVGGPINHIDLVAETILVEELVLVRSRLHPDASGTLILFREGCAYRAKALAWKRESGQQVGEVMELGTLEGILGCVTVGLGCTLMPRAVVENSRFADELIISEIPNYLSSVPTVMVSHRESPVMVCMGTLANAVMDASVAA